MVEVQNPNFNIAQILESGQCFRMRQTQPGCFELVALGQVLQLRQISNDLVCLDCDQSQFDEIWQAYFDLDTDYESVRRRIDPEDTYLTTAAAYGAGIRILRQDPWEMLVTFLISQRKSIPAIRTAVETLCRACGTPLGTNGVYAFPTPQQLARMSLEQLLDCSLGYRAKYIYKSAQCVAAGAELSSFSDLSDDVLADRLMQFYGVGRKIADCVMLFGYHRLGAFPRDVWINRVLENHYPQGLPFARYAPFEGIVQQYLFFYARLEGRPKSG